MNRASTRGFVRRACIAKRLVAVMGLIIALADVSNAAGDANDGCKPSAAGQAFRNLPAPYAPSARTDIVHTRIGGHDLFVPRNYFRHPPVGCGAEEGGILLRVLLPDLAPYSEETAEEFAAQRGHGRNMNILIRADERVRPLNELLELYLARQTQSSAVAPGLTHGVGETGDDLYFAWQGERLGPLIRCRRVEAGRSASCRHMFRYDAFDVQLTYARDYVTGWRSIERSTKGLLDRFRRPFQSGSTG